MSFVLKRICLLLDLIQFSLIFQLNAMANRAAGKGYENEDNYSNIKFQFIGIENIHVMRNSLQKMLEGTMLLSWKLEEIFHLPVSQIRIIALKAAAVKMGMKRGLCLLQLCAAACWLMGLVQWSVIPTSGDFLVIQTSCFMGEIQTSFTLMTKLIWPQYTLLLLHLLLQFRVWWYNEKKNHFFF